MRIGYDNVQRNEVVGALLRIPVLPGGSVELMPNADVTFLTGLKEYQVNFELVYLTAGRAGGLYAGGGVGFRNSVFGSNVNGPRESIRTFSVVVGARFGGLGRLRPQVETRIILQNELGRNPQQVMIGLSIPLWSP